MEELIGVGRIERRTAVTEEILSANRLGNTHSALPTLGLP